MIGFKGHRFEKDVILFRWYLAYSLSYRNLEEKIQERGIEVDHSNIYCWVQKFTLQLETVFRKGKKRQVGRSWRMDETYIKIKGQWKYLRASTAPLTRRGRSSTFCSPLTAHRTSRQEGCSALIKGSRSAARSAGQNHDRQQRR